MYTLPATNDSARGFSNRLDTRETTKQQNLEHLSGVRDFVCIPPVGVEPTLPKKLDFESSASANSATEAFCE